MKDIKLVLTFCLAVLFMGAITAQNITDNNGRAPGEKPTIIVKEDNIQNTPQTDEPVSDADIPGSYPDNSGASEWTFPTDLDELSEEMSVKEIAEKLGSMEEQLQAFKLQNEQLQLENRTIKKSLNNCCDASKLGLAYEDAYLLQNAPNPFSQATVLSYFIPQKSEKARLEVCNTEGKILEQFVINNKGLGTIDLEAQALPMGTYIYSLYIEDKIIDSKVMVITK